MKTSPRIYFLDALRSFAMIGGVFFHSMLAYMTIEAPDWFLFDPMPGAEVLDGLVWLMHRVRIPLFFMISGFLCELVLHKKGTAYFLKKRVFKILLPFLLALVIIIPIMLELYKGLHMNCGVGLCEFNWSRIYLLDSLKQVSPAHLWFLYYLFLYSLIAPLMSSASASASEFKILHTLKIKLNHYVLIISLSILHFFMDDVMSMNKTSGFMIDPLVFSYFFLFFLWGMKNYSFKIPKLKKVFPISILGALTSMVSFLLMQKGFINESAGVYVVICIATSVYAVYFIMGTLRWAELGFSKPSKFIAYMSHASYWIYLWHIIPVVFLQAVLAPLQWPVMLKYLVTSLGSLSLLIIFYHFFARNNFIGAWLNGYKKEI